MTVIPKLSDAWSRFFLDPVSSSTLGLVRIAFGLVVTGWTLSLAPDLATFYSDDGMLAAPPDRRWWIGVLHLADSPGVVVGVWAVMLLAAIALTVGVLSRVAAIVVAVGLVSFQHRNPWVNNSGDLLVRQLGVLLALAPVGAALSVDRWLRHRGSFWDHPSVAPWVLRLIQLNLSFGYLVSVWAKLRGTTWNDGTAVAYALRIEDLERFSVPSWVANSDLLVNLLTWGTLATEVSLAILIWNRQLRPWVIAAGLAMHLGIDLTLEVGFFGFAVAVSYLAFTPPEVADRWVERVRERFAKRQPAPAT